MQPPALVERGRGIPLPGSRPCLPWSPPALLAPRDGSSFVSDRSSAGMSPTCPVPKWPRSYLASQERCVGCNPAGALVFLPNRRLVVGCLILQSPRGRRRLQGLAGSGERTQARPFSRVAVGSASYLIRTSVSILADLFTLTVPSQGMRRIPLGKLTRGIAERSSLMSGGLTLRPSLQKPR